MSESPSTPSVIDLDALLAPIEGDQPAGQYLRYSGIYDEIAEARRSDDVIAKNDYETGVKSADFRQVVSLASDTLSKESKDMQIAAWFSEALVKIYGFDGLRDACKLMAGLQDTFGIRSIPRSKKAIWRGEPTRYPGWTSSALLPSSRLR